MAKVILVGGKLCSGKTTYTRALCARGKAVLLSVDEVLLSLPERELGQRHEAYVDGVKQYLLQKSLELVTLGVDVILDWGFWRKADRDGVRAFYQARGVDCELHYLSVPDGEWRARIARRNADVLAGKSGAYFVDEGLAAKFESLFEPPAPQEVDVWVEC